MSTLFAILASLSVVGMFVGLIAPRLVRMKSRVKAGAVFSIGMFVFFIFYAVTAPPETQTLVTASPTDATSTPEGQIEQVADNAARGMTNVSNEYHLRNVIVTPHPDGGWDVDVALNGDDNLTENLTKLGIIQQISDEFIALYTSTSTVSKASVDAYLRLTDKYGNTNDSVIYSATLYKATASKVNWSADTTLLKSDILPGVWHTDFDLF